MYVCPRVCMIRMSGTLFSLVISSKLIRFAKFPSLNNFFIFDYEAKNKSIEEANTF